MSDEIVTLGIDLGTTNTVASIVEGSTVRVIKQSNGDDLLPSLVAINKKTGERLIGKPAENVKLDSDWDFIRSVKSSMGTDKIIDKITGEEIQVEKKDASGKKIKGYYRPEDISAMILNELRRAAEESVGHSINRAIITVPAYFDNNQRKATKIAGEITGLEVDMVINEPTAAAIDFGFRAKKKGAADGITLIYDFGGGTFDVSVIDIDGDQFNVLSTGGDSHLGGDDIDKVLFDYLIEKFNEEYPPRQIIQTFDLDIRMYEEAIKAKKDLSFQSTVNISLPMIAMGTTGPVNASLSVTREEFEDLIRPLVQRTIDITAKILRESGYKSSQLESILLVGGSTRIPLVKQMIEEELGVPINLTVDPDLVVSTGAAVHGGHLNGELDDVVLLDVTPHDMGVILVEDEFGTLINKNSTIPLVAKDVYYNVSDYQSTVHVQVIQGDKELPASSAQVIGAFEIDITKARAGESEIELTFAINTDGMLDVTAMDVKTKKKKTVRVESLGTMEDYQIEHSKLIFK